MDGQDKISPYIQKGFSVKEETKPSAHTRA